MSMHASIEPDLARWDGAVAALGDDAAAEQGTLADLMHSLDLSVYSRLVIGRHIRTEYMLPPEEVGQRFAGGLDPAAERRAARVPSHRRRQRSTGDRVGRWSRRPCAAWRRPCNRSTSTLVRSARSR